MEKLLDHASKQADDDTLGAFEEAIRELERVAGDFLTGPGRLTCLRAFEDDSDAFRFLVAKTLKRRDARGLGLFVKIVREEHREVSARLRRAAPTTDPDAAVVAVTGGLCWICDVSATGRFAGQFWCKAHLEEELRSRGMAA
jgi:hypothetical protein